MSAEQKPAPDEMAQLANAVMTDWDNAMDSFFEHVENEASRRGMDAEQVRQALDRGYGDVVADHWVDWSEGEVR